MDEKSKYYELLVSSVSDSSYFKSRIKSIRRELVDYMHSESFRKDFDRLWEDSLGLEGVVKLAVPSTIPIVRGAGAISAVA